MFRLVSNEVNPRGGYRVIVIVIVIQSVDCHELFLDDPTMEETADVLLPSTVTVIVVTTALTNDATGSPVRNFFATGW